MPPGPSPNLDLAAAAAADDVVLEVVAAVWQPTHHIHKPLNVGS
ncbi:hypothetical protein HanXRQr2_Chr08g0338891 [Helianthus annuus]|uniref:Uncharacterized protein n=1 Tax=Helianthus annuus TaxID=4232 RepID=A0A9K3IEB0_HELAN|nr:hypothetical protein HanXRQr2_Chr08g0338891 [Helianthus annuus]KAJ0538879.1 hypothetical protein HanHA300_Chr08g0279991 [Helianthus annuus]KAJ0722422.1 hypothetical protein HanOQP8_Chr08g0286481 [Helianthus annuus]